MERGHQYDAGANSALALRGGEKPDHRFLRRKPRQPGWADGRRRALPLEPADTRPSAWSRRSVQETERINAALRHSRGVPEAIVLRFQDELAWEMAAVTGRRWAQ